MDTTLVIDSGALLVLNKGQRCGYPDGIHEISGFDIAVTESWWSTQSLTPQGRFSFYAFLSIKWNPLPLDVAGAAVDQVLDFRYGWNIYVVADGVLQGRGSNGKLYRLLDRAIVKRCIQQARRKGISTSYTVDHVDFAT